MNRWNLWNLLSQCQAKVSSYCYNSRDKTNREPDTHGIKGMDESQGEIQKYSHAHHAVLKDVFQFIDICGPTWRMISVQHP